MIVYLNAATLGWKHIFDLMSNENCTYACTFTQTHTCIKCRIGWNENAVMLPTVVEDLAYSKNYRYLH